MSTLPKALRLADELTAFNHQTTHAAAAELRRLYAEVDKLSYRLAYPDNFVNEECDELLKALKLCLPLIDDYDGTNSAEAIAARAAIAKAEGAQHG